MTDDEMTTNITELLDDERFEKYIPAYLKVAKSLAVSRLYPFKADATWEDVPEKYHAATCDIVVYLINRRGSEGELQHSESGVLRSYESAGVPESYLRIFTPMVGVPR